jgi:hypothetical protein
MSTLLSFVIGLVLFYAIVECVNVWNRRRKLRQRQSEFASESDKELNIDRARVARDLDPLVSSLPLTDSKITVVDDAFTNVSSKRKRHLRTAINSWVNKGASVDYLLLSGGHDTVMETRQWSTINKPNFRFYTCSVPDEHARELDFLLGGHPVLVTTPSGKALWEEGKRGERGLSSFNVRWVPPHAMDGDNLEKFHRYEEAVALLRGMCKLR